jgi:hypothetical protein
MPQQLVETTNAVSKAIPVVIQNEPQQFYSSQGFSVAVGFVLGLTSAILIEWLKRFIWRPDLTVKFGKTPPLRLPAVSGVGNDDAIYVRGAVQNRSWTRTIAKDCRAYLAEMEEWNGDRFIPVDFYADTLRLRWAYEGKENPPHEGVDVPTGVTLNFDLMSSRSIVREGQTEVHRMVQVFAKGLRTDPERLLNKLEANKRYRFTVVMVAENAAPHTVRTIMQFGASWDALEVVA